MAFDDNSSSSGPSPPRPFNGRAVGASKILSSVRVNGSQEHVDDFDLDEVSSFSYKYCHWCQISSTIEYYVYGLAFFDNGSIKALTMAP